MHDKKLSANTLNSHTTHFNLVIKENLNITTASNALNLSEENVGLPHSVQEIVQQA